MFELDILKEKRYNDNKIMAATTAADPAVPAATPEELILTINLILSD